MRFAKSYEIDKTKKGIDLALFYFLQMNIKYQLHEYLKLNLWRRMISFYETLNTLLTQIRWDKNKDKLQYIVLSFHYQYPGIKSFHAFKRRFVW